MTHSQAINGDHPNLWLSITAASAPMASMPVLLSSLSLQFHKCLRPQPILIAHGNRVHPIHI